MATASYRSTFTGVTDATTDAAITNTGTGITEIGTTYINTAWEVNVLERNTGSTPALQYTEAPTPSSNPNANKIDPAEAKYVANLTARALLTKLGSSYTTTRVQKITVTIEMKN